VAHGRTPTSGTLAAVTTAVSVLAAIVLGLAAGAMLAEAAVLMPFWRSLPADAFLAWYREHAGLLLAFFGPLEIAAAVLAIAAAILSAMSRRTGLAYFVASALLAIAVLAFFPLYFQATNESFATGTVDRARLADELVRYAWLHGLRTAAGTAAFAAAVAGVRRTAIPASPA
jgi:hypothetical protein